MKLTDNFHKIEFESRDGSDMPQDVLENIKLVAKNLQVIRGVVGKPITINSAYRSPAHNKAIGGVSNSYHVKGLAADIVVKGVTTRKLANTIRRIMNDGLITKGGVGLYNTFVHVDFRGHLAKWDKSSLFNF